MVWKLILTLGKGKLPLQRQGNHPGSTAPGRNSRPGRGEEPTLVANCKSSTVFHLEMTPSIHNATAREGIQWSACHTARKCLSRHHFRRYQLFNIWTQNNWKTISLQGSYYNPPTVTGWETATGDSHEWTGSRIHKEPVKSLSSRWEEYRFNPPWWESRPGLHFKQKWLG